MKSAKRVIKNTGILYARMLITIFISLYSTRLILASLGVENFGIFNLVAGSIAMLTFLNNAMATATQRFMSHSEGSGDVNKTKNIYNVSVVIHLLVALVIFLLLELLGFFLFNGVLNISADRIEAATWVYQCMVASTIFTIISVPDDALLNAHENMLAFAILSILEALMKLGIALIISSITSFDKLSAYGSLTAISAILVLVFRRFYCHAKYKNIKVNIFSSFDKKLFKEMSNFGGWSFLGASSSMLSNYGQGILLNAFFGTSVNAAQGIVGQLKGQLSAFATTLLKAINPVITKSEGAGERSLSLKVSIEGSKYSFLLLALFFIPVLVETSFIFELWLNNIPPFLITFCRLSLIVTLIQQLFLPLTSAIFAVGDIKFFQVVRSLLNILPLLLAYILFIFGYPPYFIYISFIIYSLLDAMIILYFANIKCELRVNQFITRILLPCIFVFMLSTAISIFLNLTLPTGFFRVVLIGITGTLSTIFGTLYIILSPGDRAIIASLYSRKLENV